MNRMSGDAMATHHSQVKGGGKKEQQSVQQTWNVKRQSLQCFLLIKFSPRDGRMDRVGKLAPSLRKKEGSALASCKFYAAEMV